MLSAYRLATGLGVDAANIRVAVNTTIHHMYAIPITLRTYQCPTATSVLQIRRAQNIAFVNMQDRWCMRCYSVVVTFWKVTRAFAGANEFVE